MIYPIDLLGTFVFAVSGALAASRKNMDIFGFSVMALLPAVGGGTVRDVLIGRRPIFWIEDTNYIAVAICAAVVTYFSARWIDSRMNLLRWMDALGLALFAVLGCRIALAYDTSIWIAIIMGTVTAVTGGMIRDVVCNEIPLILSREIYATAAFAGAATYALSQAAGLSQGIAMLAGVLVGFAIRSAGIMSDWSLPAYRQRPPATGRKESANKHEDSR